MRLDRIEPNPPFVPAQAGTQSLLLRYATKAISEELGPRFRGDERTTVVHLRQGGR